MIRYVVITPVRNEEKFIDKTLHSVTNQIILPVQWIIVNDGSTDSTPTIIEQYVKKHSWIKRIDLSNKGFRAGEGPAHAFNEGMKYVNCEYEFIVNLDGDVSFDKYYFNNIFEKFLKNSKLGIASGKSYYLENGKMVLYRCLDTSTMGPSKVYRKECFHDTGSLLECSITWDMLDDLKAQRSGWETRSFPDITFVHYKKIGAMQGLHFKTFMKEGKILYCHGYHPLYITAKSFYRMLDKPYFLLGFGILCGYILASLKNDPKIEDKEMIRFLRQRQLKQLSFWKSK